MPIISKDVWITREGRQMEIKGMASSHLLATIHLIERNRFLAAADCYHQEGLNKPDKMEMVNYYLEWPIQYPVLIAEAERRGLISRCNHQVEVKKDDSNSLVPRR